MSDLKGFLVSKETILLLAFDRFSRHPISFLNPAAKVDQPTSFAAERPIGIIMPLGTAPALRTGYADTLDTFQGRTFLFHTSLFFTRVSTAEITISTTLPQQQPPADTIFRPASERIFGESGHR
jgi:hypothetical protein